MTTETIEYTYTTYQQPVIRVSDFIENYLDFGVYLVATLRTRGFLGSELVSIFVV